MLGDLVLRLAFFVDLHVNRAGRVSRINLKKIRREGAGDATGESLPLQDRLRLHDWQ